jgi:hypothetical protein
MSAKKSKVIVCAGCKVAIHYDPDVQFLDCPHCGYELVAPPLKEASSDNLKKAKTGESTGMQKAARAGNSEERETQPGTTDGGKPYQKLFKKYGTMYALIIIASHHGASTRKIAEALNISHMTVFRVLKAFHQDSDAYSLLHNNII